MKGSYVRPAVAAVLFAGWIGWLIYLVVTTRNPVILSRPQLLAADLCVIAILKGKDGSEHPDNRVTVREVIWPAAVKGLAGTEIEISGLTEFKLPKEEREDNRPPRRQGWRGPGAYILPLTIEKFAKGQRSRVTAVPPSPGFEVTDDRRIYPATSQALAQLQLLASHWNK